MLAFRMTLTGEETEMGQKESPGMPDHALGERQTLSLKMLGPTDWEAALPRRAWGSWWTYGWPWASSVPSRGLRQAGKCQQAERWSFPSALLRPIWSAVSSAGLPGTRETWTCWSVRKWTRRWLKDWSIFLMKRSWRSSNCSAWRSYQSV